MYVAFSSGTAQHLSGGLLRSDKDMALVQAAQNAAKRLFLHLKLYGKMNHNGSRELVRNSMA